MLTLQPKSLDWALNQAELLGDSAIFPLPFEFEAIRNDWDELRKNLSQENILNRDSPWESSGSMGRPNWRVVLQGQSISGVSDRGCDSCREPCYLSVFIVFGPPPVG